MGSSPCFHEQDSPVAHRQWLKGESCHLKLGHGRAQFFLIRASREMHLSSPYCQYVQNPESSLFQKRVHLEHFPVPSLPESLPFDLSLDFSACPHPAQQYRLPQCAPHSPCTVRRLLWCCPWTTVSLKPGSVIPSRIPQPGHVWYIEGTL